MYSTLNILWKKMNKKVIILILVFIVGIGGGMLLSRIGNDAKSDTKKNNSHNVSSNTTAINNTNSGNSSVSKNNTNSENKTTKSESSNTSKANTTKSENKTSQNDKTESAKTDLSTYKAVWQYPDSTYPEQEFKVKSINDSTVNFDYTIDGITTFENASASISGNIAKFDIKNDGDWNIKGTITFEDNKVIFEIKESSSENIPTGSTTFKVKSNKSAF